MNIDFHTHCDSNKPEDWDRFVGICKQNNTIACICSATPRGDHQPPYASNSEVLQAAQSYPENLIPFAYVDLWDKKISKDAIKKFSQQGFRGLKCIAPYYAYDHDFYMPVYEMAASLNMPVLFHTGVFRPSIQDAVHRRPTLMNMQPVRLDRIARSFPELKIVMAHLGTTMWRAQAVELIKLHPNLYADLAGCGSFTIKPDVLNSYFAGDIELSTPNFKLWEKLILGSDAYFTVPDIITKCNAAYGKLLKTCNVPANISEKIMGQTTSEWFRLS